MQNQDLKTRILLLLQDSIEQEKYERAISYLDCIDQLNPRNLPTEILIDLGKYAEKLGKTDRAIDYYQLIVSRGEIQFEKYMKLANLYILQGRFGDAIQILNQIIECSDSHLEAHHLLRDANYLQIKLETALGQYIEALNMNENHSFIVHRYKGLVLFVSHQYKLAIEAYQKALSFEQNDTDLLYEMGLAYLFRDDLDNAQEAFEKILHYAPKQIMALTQLAHIFAVREDSIRSAELVKQVLELSTQRNVSTSHLPPVIEQDRGIIKKQCPVLVFPQKGIPIVYIHRDMGQDPLIATPIEYSLAQTKKYNPRSEIYLISDGTINCDFVNLEFMIDYYEEAHQFAKVYKHICKKVRFDYLLFCSQRWFIMKEFMMKKGFERCIHLDSDVMLFTNLTDLDSQVGTYDFKMSAHPDFAVSGHYNIVGSYKILETFCNYLYEMYATPLSTHDTSSMKKAIWESNVGYITDMSAFEEFTQKGLGSLFNLSAIFDNSTFDANINSADGFEVKGGMKNMYWRDNRAFCKMVDTGQEIRFHGLHFNERAKKYMQSAYLQQSLYKLV